MDTLDTSKRSLKKFGMTMGAALLVITLLMLIRHRREAGCPVFIAFLFFSLGLAAPGLLRPFYVLWMRFALVLGWINTRLILGVLFYLVFTPIAIVLRLLRTDLLDVRIEKQRESYWKKKEKVENRLERYDRQF